MSSSTVTRNKEGVPSWSGEPSSWTEYKTAARLYVASTKHELRYTCGPRLAAELGGAAKTAIQGQKSTWLSEPNGAEKLLRHLQTAIGEPALPEVANFMRQYFRVLRRRKGESMTAFCVRHREEYDRMCRALGRMMRENGASTTTSSGRGLGMPGSHSGTRSEEGSVQSGGLEQATAGEAEGHPTAVDTGGGSTTWSDNDWQRQWSWHSSWGSWGGWHSSPWWAGSWTHDRWGQYGANSASAEEQEEEDTIVHVLPDAVQGWFLLDKCGLDPMERSVIQGDIKSNFTLAGVENSLRSHCTDEQIRRRDGESKNQAFFQDGEEAISEPEDEPEDAFFQGWTEQEVSWYQDAREQEHHAWVQLQQARRTLKDARARQSEVKMNRKFYRPGSGKGFSKNRTPVGASPSQGPCLRCGKGHRTSDCPNKPPREEDKTLEVEHLAEFTFYQDSIEDQVNNEEESDRIADHDHNHDHDHDRDHEIKAPTSPTRPSEEQLDFFNEVYVAETSSQVSTETAIMQGKAILDPGATRSMGSLHAVEALLNLNLERQGDTGVQRVSLEERPVFGFGNSQKSKALSACYLKVPSEKEPMSFRVHVIPEGRAPILMSIETLRRLGAIVDFARDEAIFTRLCPHTLIPLERSQLGHQLLPLGEDFLSRGRPLKQAVTSLGQLSE